MEAFALGTPLQFRVKCRGRRRDGRSCLTTLAIREGPLVVVRVDGWEIVDPRSIRCPKCGLVRTLADGVPEEIGGSSGVLIDGQLVGARLAS